MKYLKTVWGTQHAFLHEDHRKKFKGNVERYAVCKEKDRVQVERKLLV